MLRRDFVAAIFVLTAKTRLYDVRWQPQELTTMSYSLFQQMSSEQYQVRRVSPGVQSARVGLPLRVP
jgi:hypothetical protein